MSLRFFNHMKNPSDKIKILLINSKIDDRIIKSIYYDYNIKKR